MFVVHTGYWHLKNGQRNLNIYFLGSALICHLLSAQGAILRACDNFICYTSVGKKSCWATL